MKNYLTNLAEESLTTALQIEMYVRKSVAKDLAAVADDLLAYDCNGNELTPTKTCIDTLNQLLNVLKDVASTSNYCRTDLEKRITEENGKGGETE